MGFVPTEAKQALKVLYSIDVSLGRIAKALEEQNKLLKIDPVFEGELNCKTCEYKDYFGEEEDTYEDE